MTVNECVGDFFSNKFTSNNKRYQQYSSYWKEWAKLRCYWKQLLLNFKNIKEDNIQFQQSSEKNNCGRVHFLSLKTFWKHEILLRHFSNIFYYFQENLFYEILLSGSFHDFTLIKGVLHIMTLVMESVCQRLLEMYLLTFQLLQMMGTRKID